MAYNVSAPTYVATDFSEIVVDFIGSFGVELLAFVAIIALIVLWKWLKKGV